MLFPSPGDLPNPEIKLTSLALAGDFLTTEPPGKPHGLYITLNPNPNPNSPDQNTGVASLSLLQGIFQTQGSNPSPALHTDSLPAEPPGKPF